MLEKKIDFSAVVFDMDGTLLDSMGYWMNAGAAYVSSLGMTPEENLGEKLFSMTMAEGIQYLAEHYAIAKSEREILDGIEAVLADAYRSVILLKDGARDFLEALSARNIPMTIATNTDRSLFEPALERLGIARYMKRIFTCTECGKSKFHPDIFFQAAEFLGSAPSETLVAEDALYAIRTAHSAGFKTLGLYDASSREDSLHIRSYSTLYCQSLVEAKKALFG